MTGRLSLLHKGGPLVVLNITNQLITYMSYVNERLTAYKVPGGHRFAQISYEHTTVRLPLSEIESAKIAFNTGVAQGSVLFPLLSLSSSIHSQDTSRALGDAKKSDTVSPA